MKTLGVTFIVFVIVWLHRPLRTAGPGASVATDSRKTSPSRG